MNHNTRAVLSSTLRKDGGNQKDISITQEKKMNNAIRNATLGLIALVCIAGTSTAGIEVLNGIEVLGIEVLGIEVLQSGVQQAVVHTHATSDHTYWMIMNVNGQDIVVDVQPVDPSGMQMVQFPAAHPNNRIELVAPDGIEVLAVTFLSDDYEDELIYQ